MPFLDQMKLQALIDLSLILILASNLEGQDWGINVPTRINASLGLDVIIPCTFTYPYDQHTANVQVYWKKREKSKFVIRDKDQNAFIFHTNKTFVLEKYRAKTELLGDKANGNCSLKIRKIMDDEPNIYVRVTTESDQYSFKKKYVSISVSGVFSTHNPDVASTPLTAIEATTMGMTQETSLPMYMAIFVPVAALLIIITIVVGIVFCKKKKRLQSFPRQESGYYANFSRAPLNQAKSQTSCKKLDSEKPPQLKAIDEPVYSNMEAPAAPLDQSMDLTDNIYANVNYSK